MYTKQQTLAASVVNIIAGLWLMVSPFILGYSGTALSTNNIILGFIVAISAAMIFYMPTQMSWLSWVNVALGVWLIIAPFMLGYASSFSFWNDIILGAIIVYTGIWSASSMVQQKGM